MQAVIGRSSIVEEFVAQWWKTVLGLIAAVFAAWVGVLIKRSYDSTDTSLKANSDAVRSATESLTKAVREFREEVQRDVATLRTELMAEMRDLSREGRNNAQQIVAVTERLGATIERIDNHETKFDAVERKWEDRFEALRKDIHARIDDAFARGVKLGREATRVREARETEGLSEPKEE